VPEFNGGTASRPRAPGDVAAWTDMRVCGRGRRQGECSLNDVPRRCGRAAVRAPPNFADAMNRRNLAALA